MSSAKLTGQRRRNPPQCEKKFRARKTLLERLQLERARRGEMGRAYRAEHSQGHMHGDQDAWEFLRREKPKEEGGHYDFLFTLQEKKKKISCLRSFRRW